MTKNVLKAISDAMSGLGIEYGFAEYSKDPIVYPYFVGEYQEQEPMNEDGMQETTFMLTGFSRSTWLSLENAKDSILNYFGYGGRAFSKTDSTFVIMYDSALVVPTDDAELKRIQINLSIKEWKVNI